MKCWECKKEIFRTKTVCYYDGYKEKHREVCLECYKKLTFTKCHFVEVERITRRQLTQKRS